MNITQKAHLVFTENKQGLELALLCFFALLMSLCFVWEQLWILPWLCLCVLFCNIFDFKKSKKRVFFTLFCYFYVFFVSVYSWFVNLYPLDFAGLSKGVSVGVIIAGLLFIPLYHSALMSASLTLGFVAAKQTKNGVLQTLSIGFSYVLGEYLQTLGTFAFPWGRLAMGQVGNLALLQSASLLGSYFVTFLIVVTNALFAVSFMELKRNKKKSIGFSLCALCVFGLNLAFGLVRLDIAQNYQGDTADVVVLQGNIPSGEKWSSGSVGAHKEYTQLSQKAKHYLDENNIDAHIAVIPETAFPVTFYSDNDGRITSYSQAAQQAVYEIARDLDAQIFVGGFRQENDDSFNSLFVVDTNGKICGTYDKIHLVPFGEFLPYRNALIKLLPFLSQMNMFSDDLSRGKSTTPIDTAVGKAGCLVCFDSIFSATCANQVRNGAQFIVISTNDSWYKKSRALDQHKNHAVLRAIENGRSVVRSANTGISAVIDPCGRTQGQIGVGKSDFVHCEILLKDDMTFFTIVGDVIVYIGMVYIAALLLIKKINLLFLSKKQT